MGTRNTGNFTYRLSSDISVARDSDSATGKGVINVVGTLRELLPNTKILLISLLPRTGVEYFDRIVGINARIRQLHDGQSIFYLDMFNRFRGDNDWGGSLISQ